MATEAALQDPLPVASTCDCVWQPSNADDLVEPSTNLPPTTWPKPHISTSPTSSQTIALSTPHHLSRASTNFPVDLRVSFLPGRTKMSLFEYIAKAQEFNEALKQQTKEEGASDDSEHIKPLEGAAAAAEGGRRGCRSRPGWKSTRSPTKAGRPSTTGNFNGERKTGDRNTDFSHVRKSAELFLDRNRSRPGRQTPNRASRAPSRLRQPASQWHRASRVPPTPPDPIILISPSRLIQSSACRTSNCLEEGIFVPPDHRHSPVHRRQPHEARAAASALTGTPRTPRAQAPMRQQAHPPNQVHRRGRHDQLRTRVLRAALVAVFTTGQTWQFKSYKWSSPAGCSRSHQARMMGGVVRMS
ncbi:hypothetical protein N7497_012381 [Penicillium chrysogenum]|nr:hypothetical protein N7497_012381 [Penicillium chrysogenum]